MASLILDNAQRKLLHAILDELIPESTDGRMPAAGALGVADFICERVEADDELWKLFSDGLAKATSFIDPNGKVDAALVGKLETDEPGFFEALLRLTYMGYYSRGDIRALLGLSPKPVHPDGYDVPEQDLGEIETLTAPVRQRGRCYRVV